MRHHPGSRVAFLIRAGGLNQAGCAKQFLHLTFYEGESRYKIQGNQYRTVRHQTGWQQAGLSPGSVDCMAVQLCTMTVIMTVIMTQMSFRS